MKSARSYPPSFASKVLWISFVLLHPAGNLAAADTKDDGKKVFVADAIENLVVRTEHGTIDAKGSERLTITVEQSENLDSKLCAVTIEPDEKTKTFRVEVKKIVPFAAQECVTSFKVEAPKRLTVRAAAKDGTVTVSGFDGDASLDTGSGAIHLDALHGAVHARSGSGAISGSITAERGAQFETGSGAIRVKGLVGEVKAKTGSGDVALEWAKAPELGDKAASSVTTGSSSAFAFFPAGSKIKTDLKSGTGSSTNEVGDTPEASFTLAMASGSGNMSVMKTPEKKK